MVLLGAEPDTKGCSAPSWQRRCSLGSRLRGPDSCLPGCSPILGPREPGLCRDGHRTTRVERAGPILRGSCWQAETPSYQSTWLQVSASSVPGQPRGQHHRAGAHRARGDGHGAARTPSPRLGSGASAPAAWRRGRVLWAASPWASWGPVQVLSHPREHSCRARSDQPCDPPLLAPGCAVGWADCTERRAEGRQQAHCPVGESCGRWEPVAPLDTQLGWPRSPCSLGPVPAGAGGGPSTGCASVRGNGASAWGALPYLGGSRPEGEGAVL